ncbi:hypothetical protein F5I97DRAFT_1936614 [Phlebopus sp. FC_14]|nr:hypothetical protein F5I97DRAFT_1936614 [Phlebopus sp. FC_14]
MPLTVPSVVNVLVKLRRAKENARALSLSFTSGEPQTHPTLCGEDATCKRRVPMVHASLFEKAEFLGANVLVEESWECTIRVPKNKKDGTFRVHIRYYASASRSSRPDPQKPVALDKVRNVPGLMTIVEREEFSP